MRHPLLRRQLKRLGLAEDAPPPSPEAWNALLDRIHRTYEEVDQDRYTLERSLSTSSAELQRLYEDLRKSSEQQLADQRSELYAIITATLEAAPDGILVVDEQKKVVAYNRRFVTLWRPEDASPNVQDDALLDAMLTSVEDPDEFLARVAYLSGHPLESSQDEITTKDGRALDRYSAPVLSKGGECRGRVWFFRDVTARRQAEEELRRTNVFLDSIVENIPDMIFVKDAQSLSFERFNRAGEELLGTPRATLLGKTDSDFFPADQAEFFQENDRATLAKGVVLEIQEEPILTHRGTRWLHTKKIPIHDANGRPKHLLGISADITERKLAQELLQRTNEELERRVQERTAELSRANAELTQEIAERERAEAALRKTEEALRLSQKMEAVGRLAGGVAHDFNNMLAVVVGCSEMLLDEVGAGSPLREDVEQIHEAAERSAALTQQLLAFSRQQVLQPEVIELNSVVEDMQRMLGRLIGEDVQCITRLEPGLPPVEVDPSQMQQVIMNLAVNARDAMPNGGHLIIETGIFEVDASHLADHDGAKTGTHVCVTFRDTGIGMDAETRARIFEPFFTTKGRGRGTGLGLATVYGIVKQSGGHIAVDSEPGRGAVFRVFLPAAACRACASKRERQKAARGGNETILLVEDEPLVRAAALRILRKNGYTVLDASGPEQAVSLAAEREHSIDLVVTDVVMPGMNGYELSRRLLAQAGSLRFLFMSGYTDAAQPESESSSEGAAFLQKPFSPPSLLRKVREVLDA